MDDVNIVASEVRREQSRVSGVDGVDAQGVQTAASGVRPGLKVTKGEASDDGEGKHSIRSSIDHGSGLKLAVEAEKEGLGKGKKDYKLEIR